MARAVQRRQKDHATTAPPPRQAYLPEPANLETRNPLRLCWTDRWLWWLIALAVVSRFILLGNQTLWIDEMLTIVRARDGILHHRLSHFGFFWVERLFMLLPLREDLSARIFPALCGIASVPVIYACGRAVGGRRVGRWAALLTLLSVTHLYYSQNARFYAPMILLGAAGWLSTIFMFERRHIRWLFPAIVADALAVTMHPTQIVFLALHLGFVGGALLITPVGRAMLYHTLWPVRRQAVARGKGPLLWHPLNTFNCLVILAALPFIVFFVIKFLPFTRSLNFSPAFILGKFTPVGSFLSAHMREFGGQFEWGLSPAGLLALAYSAITLVGISVGLWRWPREAALIVFVSLLSLLISQAYDVANKYEVRYVIFLFPFWVVAAGQGLEWIVHRRATLKRIESSPTLGGRLRLRRLALLAVLLAAATFAWTDYHRIGRLPEKPAVRWIRDHWSEGTAVFTYGQTGPPVNYYWEQFGLPAEAIYSVWEVVWDEGQMLIGQLQAMARRHRRLLFVDSWKYDDPESLRPWLDEHARLLMEWPSWLGHPVRIYEIPPPPAYDGWPVAIDPMQNIPHRATRQQYAATQAGILGAVMPGNSELVYDFDVPTSGPCTLELMGLNPIGRPVLIEVSIDGAAEGILPFVRADDTWSTSVMFVGLTRGSHVMKLRLLSELIELEGEKSKLQPAIAGIRFSSGHTAAEDDDVLPRLDLVADHPAEIPLIYREDNELVVNPSLIIAGTDRYRPDVVTGPDGNPVPALRVDVPWDQEDLIQIIYDRILPLSEVSMSYLSLRVRTRNLNNHGLNIGCWFVSAEGESIRKQLVMGGNYFDKLAYTNWMGQPYRDSWARLAGMTLTPEGAAVWAPLIMIRRDLDDSHLDATVWLYDLRIAPPGAFDDPDQAPTLPQ